MRKIILFLSFVSLSNCAIKPPDVPLCTELTLGTAYCIYTISSKEYYWNDQNKLNNETYWEARPKLLLLPASSWAEIKTFIITICKKSNQCIDNITSWERTVEKIDSIGRN